MTRTEHLLWILAEECAEVAQRASKAARFTLKEVQPGQPLNNAERICGELYDLIATVDMLVADGVLPAEFWKRDAHNTAMEKKRLKVEKFLAYSAQCGTLDEGPQSRADRCPGHCPKHPKAYDRLYGSEWRCQECGEVVDTVAD